MKIRNKLMLSYIFLILVFFIVIWFFTYFVVDELTERSFQAAKVAIEKTMLDNKKLSRKILSKYAMDIVELKASDVADDLSVILADMPIPDYEMMRKNEKLRKIVIQNIYTHDGKVAGYTDLNDDKGINIIHPNKLVEGKNLKEWKEKYPEMWLLVSKSRKEPLVKGSYDFIDKEGKTRRKYMVLARVQNTPFVVASVVNIDEFFVPVNKSLMEMGNNTIKVIEDTTEKMGQITMKKIKLSSAVAGVCLLILGFILAIFFSGSISGPINDLCDGVKKLGKGNFSTTVPEKGSKEIIELSHGFNELGSKLDQYMKKLRQEVTARQSLESELKIARRIQEYMLPKKFPERKEFNLFVALYPAKEVSGDFFDFFFIDDNTMAIVVGDVSGKGVPASMYMAVVKTALKNLCMKHPDSPSDALNETNKFLDEYRDTCMFATVFLGYYGIKTGELTFANAGHNEFVLVEPNGDSKVSGSFGDVPLGALEDYFYKQDSIILKQNEMVFIYTDGITEAVSKNGEFFGEERLHSLLKENANLSLKEMGGAIILTLNEFQGESQFDDITYMMLRRNV
ncbi:MAG: SpoIIE family protein phosphatase [Candidatus Eremiobacteraeota bacterium]|nr:SpoIIE family protein phosphatase [Candidatus Eremiobacteraeota bacterium]